MNGVGDREDLMPELEIVKVVRRACKGAAGSKPTRRHVAALESVNKTRCSCYRPQLHLNLKHTCVALTHANYSSSALFDLDHVGYVLVVLYVRDRLY